MNRARRVAVLESLECPADYADAFELAPAQPDDRPVEEWMRAGLEGAPAAVRRLVLLVHRHVLRLRLGPLAADDHVLGWRIARATEDSARLEASGPLADGVIIGRRTEAGVIRLTTALSYRRPTAARAIWAVVGPLHRRIAPLLLERAARQAAPVVR